MYRSRFSCAFLRLAWSWLSVASRLIHLRLIGARIDLGEQFALLDQLTFVKVNADQQPGDLATNRRCIQSCDRAEAG